MNLTNFQNEYINVFKYIESIAYIDVPKKLTFTHKPNTLWLEFGVASGKIINYISKFTNDYVYEFDSFKGLSEKWRDKFDNIIFCIFFVKLQHKFHSTN